MKNLAVEIKNISKSYQLGEYSSKTFADELKKLFKPKEEIIGLNDRANASHSGKVWALNDVNINIKEGEVVGIIGKNGAGKSTLLKLLSRVTSPSQGDIYINGRIGALLEVGTGFQPDLTGRENVFLNGAILGMTKAEINAKLDDIVAFSGVSKYLDTPVKRYSSGMMVRLGFAVAAHLEPEILVIDEVLAVGDQEFQDQCVQKMKTFADNGKRVLFVSHNMASVKSLCNRGIVLEKGSVAFDGDIDQAIQFYLSKQDKTNADGFVEAGKGVINTNEVVFNRIQLLGATQKNRNAMMYGEDILLECEINSTINLAQCNAEIVIHSADNYRLGNANNVFENVTIAIKKGSNSLSCIIKNNFLSGYYYVLLSVHSGKLYFYRKKVYEFKLNKVLREAGNFNLDFIIK